MVYFIEIDLQASAKGPCDRGDLAALLRTIADCVESDNRATVLPIDDGHGVRIGVHGFVGSDFEEDTPVFAQAQAVRSI